MTVSLFKDRFNFNCVLGRRTNIAALGFKNIPKIFKTFPKPVITITVSFRRANWSLFNTLILLVGLFFPPPKHKIYVIPTLKVGTVI